MRILIYIGHPAHVHVFKYYYHEMVEAGNEVLFTTKDKECTIDLLNAYSLPYELLGTPFSGAIKKVYGLWYFGRKLYKVAKGFCPDLFVSISSMYAAQVAYFMTRPHLVLDDTEHSGFEHILYRPFSTMILTPSCFEKHMGSKQKRYDGYHELAYLHPNRFNANTRVLAEMGLAPDERFSLVRLVSWNAGHDIKGAGMSFEDKMSLIQMLDKLGKVFISSEKELPVELEKYRIRIRPEDMHDVLAAAALYAGEGASMASECAMLATPAIYINSLDAGTLKEQSAYGLICSFRNFDGVLETAETIMTDSTVQVSLELLRNQMLEEKIDVTELIVGLSRCLIQERSVEPSLFTKLNFRIW
jgi:predicted glycosyltransferase